MNDDKIRIEASKFAEKEYISDSYEISRIEFGFFHGAKWALENQWISVKDKLPSKDNDYVLCHLEVGDEIVSGFIGKDNKVETSPSFEFDAMDDYVCDYWMPIPKLPKEETK